MAKEPLTELKMLLREAEVPFFSDEEIGYHLERAGGDVDTSAYRLLLIKAENSTLQLSGLTVADTSAYWKRLAAMYRPNGSCVLKGG